MAMSTTQTLNGMPAERRISNEIDISSPFLKEPSPEKRNDSADDNEDPRNFTFPVYKKFKIRIYKPLILLKLALFLWYGAASAAEAFLTVFVNQKGLTLTEFSTIHAIMPVMKFIGSAVSGIVADKIGKSKPVLVANILLTAVSAIGMLVTPSLKVANCNPQPVSVICDRDKFGRLITITSCDANADIIELVSCNVTCLENITRHCIEQNLLCEVFTGNENVDNFSVSIHVSCAYELKPKYYYNVTSMSYKNISYSWCNAPHNMHCKMTCLMNYEEDCPNKNTGRTNIFILHAILLILFSAAFTNCFRFMDVTSMSLVKKHNSVYGRQRFFAITGNLVFCLSAGYIVDATTFDEINRNYDAIFYILIVTVSILLPIIYKLDVKIIPPGNYMWKKSLYLLKNLDVISFAFVLLILGTAWGFTIIYLYLFLNEINSPAVLLGFVHSASALYGLPFLVTSNWFIEKIGTNQIFILGLLGHAVKTIGYSLLYNPWLSLLIELTSVFTYHLLWVAVVVHSHSLATEGLTATVIALAGAIHFTLGVSFGGLIGGQIMEAFGGRAAFRVMAVICLTSAVFYAIYLYIRKTCYTVQHTMDNINGVKNEEQNEMNTMPERLILTRHSV